MHNVQHVFTVEVPDLASYGNRLAPHHQQGRAGGEEEYLPGQHLA